MLRNNAIPLYYQLETLLRRKIYNGEYPLGSPIPSEDALSEEYGVSRITVRQALAALESDKLIMRHRGRGTFVSENIRDFGMPRFTGSIEDLVLMGIQTKTELVDFSWVEATEFIKKKLRVKEDKVLRVEKIRRTKEGPLSHVFNYLPQRIGEQVDKQTVRKKPMLMILEEDLGIQLPEADQTVEAIIADTTSAQMLEVRVGEPLLKTERVVYDADMTPVEYVSVFYRADRFAYTMKLRRNPSNKTSWGTV